MTLRVKVGNECHARVSRLNNVARSGNRLTFDYNGERVYVRANRVTDSGKLSAVDVRNQWYTGRLRTRIFDPNKIRNLVLVRGILS